MGRRLFAYASALSLLLCLATLIGWSSSFFAFAPFGQYWTTSWDGIRQPRFRLAGAGGESAGNLHDLTAQLSCLAAGDPDGDTADPLAGYAHAAKTAPKTRPLPLVRLRPPRHLRPLPGMRDAHRAERTNDGVHPLMMPALICALAGVARGTEHLSHFSSCT